VLLGGCGGTQRPKAELLGVAVTERTAEGARMEARVRLQNPNDFPLPLTRVRQDFALLGHGRYQATHEPSKTLPGRGEVTLVLPAAVTRGGEKPTRRFRVSARISYRPPGEMRKILTGLWVPLPSVSVRGEGALTGNDGE
jgi:hypothetical protein